MSASLTRKRKNPLKKWPYIFFAPFLLCYLCFSFYPTMYSLYVSFTSWSAVDMFNRPFVGLRNYVNLFTKDALFWKAMLNTFYLMLLAMPGTIVLGLLIAALLHNTARGRQLFQTIAFLPYIVTPVAIGFIFSYLFDWNVGPVNKILSSMGLIGENVNWLGDKHYAPYVVAMMNIWKNFGYFMVLYLAGMSNVPEELYEAARVDGTNARQTFFRITLPMLRPVTVFVVVNGIIGGLQLFDEVVQVFGGGNSAIVGGPERSVLTAVWYFFDTSFRNNSRYGYGAAIAFSIFLIIAVVSLVNVGILNRKED